MHYGITWRTRFFQRPWEPLHSHNDAQMPAVRVVQGDRERVYGLPVFSLSPLEGVPLWHGGVPVFLFINDVQQETRVTLYGVLVYVWKSTRCRPYWMTSSGCISLCEITSWQLKKTPSKLTFKSLQSSQHHSYRCWPNPASFMLRQDHGCCRESHVSWNE